MDIQTFLSYFFRYIEQQSSGVKWEPLVISWAISAILVHLCMLCYARLTGKEIDRFREGLWILIVCYFCFGSQITIFQRVAGSRTRIVLNLNFGNLLGDFFSRQQFFYTLLNVLFFVPWGFLWGLYRKDYQGIKRVIMVACYSFLTCFVIEVTQLVTQRGHFEVSDIVTNVTGGVLGGLFAGIVINLYGWIWKRVKEREGGSS